MNARRTHALSFLLNGDLQLMSSGRQTGRRLGGWGARPEEGAAGGLQGQSPAGALQDWLGRGLQQAGRDADWRRVSGHRILAGAWWRMEGGGWGVGWGGVGRKMEGKSWGRALAWAWGWR